MYFLSSDVGGTFTDLVLFDSSKGRILVDKVSSTGESAEGIVFGIQRMLKAAGIEIEQVERFVLGSTIATNTWLTRRGAKVAFVVTDGFRDVLEIATQRRADLHSLRFQREAPIVPRSHFVEVRERMDAFGEITIPLTEQEVERAVEAIKAQAPDAVAISLLFSFLNESHERQLEAAIKRALPNVPVFLSTLINPEIEEYPRASTTATAAYVGPVITRYVSSLEAGLRNMGLRSPWMLMRSDGGVMTPQACSTNPAAMLLSGPAGGVIAAARLGEVIGVANMVTFDMGGTSADFSIIADGQPRISTEKSIHDQVLRVPMLDIETISAGGGSIGSVDQAGALHVGPQSAGSNPGPACYGRGGLEPTLTDACVVLGIVSPDDMAGGDLKLIPEASREAIRSRIADPLGVTVEEAAFGMVSVSCAQMRQAIRALSVERGYDIRRFSLLAFGGAGPIFAALMEPDLGVEEVIIPPRPGVFAAMGLQFADIKHNLQAVYPVAMEEVDPADLSSRFQTLGIALEAALEADGIGPEQRNFTFAADFRYLGQFHSISVPVSNPSEADWWKPEDVVEEFHRLHEQAYGHQDLESPVEIVNIRAEGVGTVQKPTLPMLGNAGKSAEPFSYRRILFKRNGDWMDVPVYRRGALAGGSNLEGPAVVSQSDTTVLILPSQMARVDDFGVIHIRSRVDNS